MSSCPTFDGAGPSGIAEALRVVDCMSGEAASFAFARLFGTDALLGQARRESGKAARFDQRQFVFADRAV